MLSKSFLTRALSAVVALFILFLLYTYLKISGLKIAVVFSVVVGTWEFIRVMFKNESSRLLKSLFFGLTLVVFASSIFSMASAVVVYALALILLITASLLISHKTVDLAKILEFHGKSSLGLFYVGLLPSFTYKILQQPQGLQWFVFLLASVFAGDTMAYIFGVLFGKHKVMPSVSPKKTWQGSVGGIIGSLSAGLICWLLLFPENSLSSLLVLAGLAGFFGQFGDFFESLLKRVAQVKDSGKIMPGHGGVLDRIDGVLFAAPVILAGILTLSHLLS